MWLVFQEAEDADSRARTRSQVSVEYNDVNKMTIAPLQLKIKGPHQILSVS